MADAPFPRQRRCAAAFRTIRFRDIGDRWGLSVVHSRRGYLSLRQGDGARAVAFFRAAVPVFRQTGERLYLSRCIDGLAGAALLAGEAARAARLFGAAEALREAVGAVIGASDRPAYDRAVAAARSVLSEDELSAQWANGRAMSLDQAVAYALDEVPDS